MATASAGRGDLAIKAFGQREKLTRRLKRILSGYPFDKEVLKELVQNADDAGASTLVLVTDRRTTLPVHTVQGRRWQSLQNPALCVYSDSAFTRADLQGIQDLGQGSKETDPTKTGQYGVGFNAVYHFTETPTFLSEGPEVGKVLCALDPHAAYVPEASHSNLGCMFDDVNLLEAQHPGITDGFLTDHPKFPMKNATMFRFPLRTPQQAKSSEISKTPVDIKHMKLLLTQLEADAAECLLFLNSIKSIEFGELDTFGHYSKKYRVDASVSYDDQRQITGFQGKVHAAARRLGDQSIRIDQVKVAQVSYTMNIDDSAGRKDSWHIMQRIGVTKRSQVAAVVSDAYAKGDLGMLPRGGVACLVKSNVQDVSQSYDLDHRLFCFLPLPQRTGLPVHVNGHFALDNESRRGLWQDDGGLGYRSQWNTMLLDHVIAPLYVDIMKTFKGWIGAQDGQGYLKLYKKLFPGQGVGFVEKTLAASVYSLQQHTECLPVTFPGDRIAWYLPERCFFHAVTDELVEILLLLGFPLVSRTSRKIYQSFSSHSALVKVMKRSDVLQFLHGGSFQVLSLQDRALKPLASTPFKVASVLKIYQYLCEKAKSEKSFLQSLDGLPLMVTAAGKIGYFSRHRPVICTKYHNLCHDRLDSFVHPCLNTYLNNTLAFESGVVKKLTMKTLVDLLPDQVRRALYLKPFCPLAAVETEWLTELWEFVGKQWSAWENSQGWRSSNTTKDFMLSKKLKALYEWCILPAQDVKRGKVLIPLGEAASVVDTDGATSRSQAQRAVAGAVKACGLPSPLYLEGSSPTVRTLMSGMVAKVDNPDGVLYALKALREHGYFTEELPHAEVRHLISYFSKHLADLEDVPDARQTLQLLPGYRCMDGTYVSLENRKAYVLPSDIPLTDMDAWTTGGGGDIVFLADAEDLKQLFKFVGCHYLSVAEVYGFFVLPQFEMLTPKGRSDHIWFLKDKLMEKHTYYCGCDMCQTAGIIFNALKSTAFVSCPNGQLRKTDELFDPGNEVFAYFEQKHLAPDPHRDPMWIDFLRKCGLTYQVDESQLLAYAKRVAADKKDKNGAKILVEHLFRNPPLGHVLQQLGKIPFLPKQVIAPEKVSLLNGRFRNNGSTRICFNGSVMHRHLDLVWTCKNVLHRSLSAGMVMADTCVLKGLGVIEKPTVSDVLDHVTNVTNAVLELSEDDRSKQARVIKNLFNPIHDFFEENLAVLTPDVKRKLESLAMVFIVIENLQRDIVATYLVRANQLAEYGKHIPPYLIRQIPRTPGAGQSTLLMTLGMQECATVEQYASVLSELYHSAEGNMLNPVEHRCAYQALCGLMEALLSTEQETILEKLFLPSMDRKMYKSTEVVFVDNKRLAEGVKELGRPCLLEVTERTPDLYQQRRALDKLPQRLRPESLSNLIEEVIDEEATQSVDNLSTHALTFKSVLVNNAFHSCILRLLKTSALEIGAEFELTPADIAERMERIEVVTVKSLKTCLEDNQHHAKMEGTSREENFFVQDTQDKHRVYIMEGGLDKTDEELLTSGCSEIIGRLFHHQIKDLHLVAMCLRCDPGRISGILDGKKIMPIEGVSNVQTQHQYQLGAYLPDDLHFQLIPSYVNFKAGEDIAVELHDPGVDPEAGTGNGTDAPTYIIGRVLLPESEKDASGTPLSGYSRRYHVQITDTSRETRIYSASKLYRFDRKWRENRPTDVSRHAARERKTSLRLLLRESLGKDDRMSVIKRLLLYWQPHNKVEKPLCMKMLALIEKETSMSTTEMADDYHDSSGTEDEDDDDSGEDGVISTVVPACKAQPRTSAAGNAAPTPGGNMMSYMAKRAKHHARDQQRYEEAVRRSSRLRAKPFVCAQQPNQPNPQPREAKRWLKQARRDLNGAQRDLEDTGEETTFEWTCCKAFQASEKALKALSYALDADTDVSGIHQLQQLLHKVTELGSRITVPEDIATAVTSLSKAIPDPCNMLYPRVTEFPGLPGDRYTEVKVVEICRLAAVIVKWADGFM